MNFKGKPNDRVTMSFSLSWKSDDDGNLKIDTGEIEKDIEKRLARVGYEKVTIVCSVCGEKFNNRGEMMAHARKVHPKE